MPAKTPFVPTRLAQVGAPTNSASAREHPASAPRHDQAPTRFAVLRSAPEFANGNGAASLEAADPWTVPVAVRDMATEQRTVAEEAALRSVEMVAGIETVPRVETVASVEAVGSIESVGTVDVQAYATASMPSALPERSDRDEEVSFLRWLNTSDDMVSEHKDETGWEEGRSGMLGRFVDRLRQARPR